MNALYEESLTLGKYLIEVELVEHDRLTRVLSIGVCADHPTDENEVVIVEESRELLDKSVTRSVAIRQAIQRFDELKDKYMGR